MTESWPAFLSITSPLGYSQGFSAEQLRLPGKKGIGYSLPLSGNSKGTPRENDATRKEHGNLTVKQVLALWKTMESLKIPL